MKVIKMFQKMRFPVLKLKVGTAQALMLLLVLVMIAVWMCALNPGWFVSGHTASINWFTSRLKTGLSSAGTLSAAEEGALEGSFYRFMRDIVDYKCEQSVRVGSVRDGGWDICTDQKYRPRPLITPQKRCLVYSFGIGWTFAFDDAMSTMYGCQVMAYDPSIGKPDHNRSSLVSFFNTGLGGKDRMNGTNNWKIVSFPTLLKDNKHIESVIDVLKIDIEFSEWDALESMLSRPSSLSRVKQLIMEIHLRDVFPPASSSAVDLLRYWRLLTGIRDVGFRAWKVHINTSSHCHYWSRRRRLRRLNACYNIFFVNVNFNSFDS